MLFFNRLQEYRNNVLIMPDWFQYLAEDVICFTSPSGHHFGLSWASQDPDKPNEIIVGCSKDGKYNVLITARRKDKCAKMCAQEIEYIPKIEQTKNDPI